MKTSRRKFMSDSLKASVGAAVGSSFILENAFAQPVGNLGEAGTGAAFEFKQIPLPYEKNALEPSIDALTMDIHYTKHHATYIKKVNEAIVAEKLTYSSEKEFFDNASKLSAPVRNNAGGAWNHNFFWQVMRPGSGAPPSGKVADAIQGTFGSVDKFKELFTQAAMTRFGSGWAWLVKDGNTLKVGSTPNQDNPMMDISELKGTPVLALDVWEHAYYLKYQNKRNEYVANWWNVVNWDEVAKRLTS